MSDLSMAWVFGALVGFFMGVAATYAYNAGGESVHTSASTRTDDWDNEDVGSSVDDYGDLDLFWPDMDGVDEGDDVFSQHPVSGASVDIGENT